MRIKKILMLALVFGITSVFFIGITAKAQTSNSFCPTLTQDLYTGLRDSNTGGQVTQLQSFLSTKYFQPVTGYFGTITQYNVIRFQAEQSLPQVGRVGPLTRAAILRVCSGVSNPTHNSTIRVTNPNGGEIVSSGQNLNISWSANNPRTGSSVVVNLYTSVGNKIGTIAISASTTGSYNWKVPTADTICTMQFPNGLCGMRLLGQYYIEASLVSGNGFDSNPTVYYKAVSGMFTAN